ncbi:MAG: BLUF domain-containing protein [Proteobacteria bacterium]|nr:BLUF domain-containing protein [Pseudomonadota bacterium]
MNLVRLIYASTFKTSTVDSSELSRIHKTANEVNAKFDITGILVFGNDYFLQCIEGEREAVNRLYTNILADSRHERSVLLEFAEIHERDFDEWSMKEYLKPEAKNSSRSTCTATIRRSEKFTPHLNQ